MLIGGICFKVIADWVKHVFVAYHLGSTVFWKVTWAKVIEL